MRTSTALLPRLNALSTRTAAMAATRTPEMESLSFLLMKALAEGAAHRALERGEVLVVLIDRGDAIAERLRVRAAGHRHVDESRGANLVLLLGEGQLFERLGRVLLLQRDCLEVGLDAQIRLRHVGCDL